MTIRVTRPLRTALGIALGGALLGGAGLYASPTLAAAFGEPDAPARKSSTSAPGADAAGAAARAEQAVPVASFRRDDITAYDVPTPVVPKAEVKKAMEAVAAEPIPSESPVEPSAEPTPTEEPLPTDTPTAPVDPSAPVPTLTPSGEPPVTGGPTTPGQPPVTVDPTTSADPSTPADPTASAEPPVSPSPSAPSEEPSAPQPTLSESAGPTPSESSSAPEPSPSVTSSAPGASPSASATPSTPAQPSTPPKPPAADKTAPTGTYKVSTGALWIGQTLTLTQGALSDNVTPASRITRTVSFGDGTPARTLRAGENRVTKIYAKPGRFALTVTLKDAAGNSRKITVATIAASVPAGKFKLNKTAVWHNENYTLKLSGIAPGTSKIVIDWADGWVSNQPGRNQTITSSFTITPKERAVAPGAKQLRATFFNKNGKSATIVVARITLKRDAWKPVVKLTKPKNPNRVASWKTIKGTVTDKGSGAAGVAMAVFQVRKNGVYCYTAKRTWHKLTTAQLYDDNLAAKVCGGHLLKVSKGKWSLPLKKVGKGHLLVSFLAFDWADNDSKVVNFKQNITRN